MFWMSPITSPIFCVDSTSPSTIALVRLAWATAPCAMDADLGDLTGDLLPRGRKFLGCGGHGLHVRGGLLRGRGDGGALARRLLGDGIERLRRALHLGSRRRGSCNDSADTLLELARGKV